ncbi:hypothetical protein VaNZ11_011927 [Volvox africanus]|uniref:Uncharacterized protein n=1 Tax=Volvox africanus TaxID=51714 RepID=A0ABQ5SCS5_9CHLO|nr:hypothetical protein VaNZ11_011927 [Volvox africanus]
MYLSFKGLAVPNPPKTNGSMLDNLQPFEIAVTEQVVASLDPTTAEVAEMLFSLRAGKRDRSTFESSPGTSRYEEEEIPLNPEERSSSSSGSACSTLPKVPCKALMATSSSQHILPLATRSYVWRGPKRSLLNTKLTNTCPAQLMSSDPDEDDVCGLNLGHMPGHLATAIDAAGAGVGERGHRDKEWAALTTWLRMNLHQPRTAKREVLFLGRHTEERGWHFFLNPALGWGDVSVETKMRLRTLPQETELAFMRKYPGKPGRDWVKKTQKYKPPGCVVTYAVPLADMIYSLTAIYYRFEGRPGIGTSSGGRTSATTAAAAQPSTEHLRLSAA